MDPAHRGSRAGERQCWPVVGGTGTPLFLRIKYVITAVGAIAFLLASLALARAPRCAATAATSPCICESDVPDNRSALKVREGREVRLIACAVASRGAGVTSDQSGAARAVEALIPCPS